MKTSALLAGSLIACTLAAQLTSRAAPDAGIAADNPHLKVRSGLANLKDCLEKKKQCHVAFLGGSITQNTSGHTAMVPTWLGEKYPEAQITVTNAGLGSTCSTSGAFRIGSQVFGSKKEVDLLIVEFAVNDDQDAAHEKRECIRGMEGIVRQVRREYPKCELMIVHFVNPGMLAKLQSGKVPTAIEAHEQVAEHHGIISVNVAAEVADAVEAKRYTWEDYGGTHPKKFGYQVASNMIGAAIGAGLERAGKPEAYQVRAPMDSGSYDNGGFVAVGEATLSHDGWRIGKVSDKLLPTGQIRPQYSDYHVLRGDQPGAELKLEFVGRSIGAFILAGPDAGVVEVSVDGGGIRTQDLYHRHSARLNYPRSVMFATDLEPQKHELRLRIAANKNEKSKGHTMSILFFEVNGALNAKDIESIARKAVSENDTWVDQAEFEEPRRKEDGSGWSVQVWRLPKTPGGHRSVEIDQDGKVTAYHRG